MRGAVERRQQFDRFHLPRSIRYALAGLLTTVALLLRLWIAPQDVGVPFITFFPAVALSAIVGGLWPGMLSAGLGALLATYFFLPPIREAEFGLWSTIVFLFDGILVCTAIEAMHRYHRDHTRMVGELKRSRIEADNARRAAELANQTKTDFLANMSHELRTPLNAIIGFSDSMLAEMFGPLSQKYTEYTGYIHQSGQHLLALINDLLDMSAIEAGKFKLIDEIFDLEQAIIACLHMIQPRAEQGNVAVVNALPTLPWVSADRRRFTQIMLNLLSNAVKFTPAHGTVTVSARTDASGSLLVTVADTGIGMDTNDLARAMEPFSQVKNGLQRAHEGTGLGLPMSKSLVQLLGGELSINSQPNQGTTVTVQVPSWRLVPPYPGQLNRAQPGHRD